MVFGGRIAPCHCTVCALLPVPRVLSHTTRIKHKQQNGLAHDNRAAEDDAPSTQAAHEGDQSLIVDEEAEEEYTLFVDEEAFARDVVLLVVNSGLTWKGAEDMVKLFNAHCKGRMITKHLPATAYQLKRVTSCAPGNAKLLHVCRNCDFVFLDGQGVCTPCELPPMMRVKRQLLVNDVGERIRRMFANPMLAEALGYAATRLPGDGDVWDGSVMREIPTGTHIICGIKT
jgi:hypothetical protein